MFGSLIQHVPVKVKGALPASWVRQKCLVSARNMEKHLKRVEAEACWKREKNMFEVEILQEACVETLGPFRLAVSRLNAGWVYMRLGWCIYTRLSQD